MTTFSTLYEIAVLPTTHDVDGGTVRDGSQWNCGSVSGAFVLHGQPGTTVPVGATRVIRDGTTAWTWTEIAAEQPDTWRACVAPHRWDEEPTDAQLDASAWPLLQPTV